jgi:hypothetical protein
MSFPAFSNTNSCCFRVQIIQIPLHQMGLEEEWEGWAEQAEDRRDVAESGDGRVLPFPSRCLCSPASPLPGALAMPDNQRRTSTVLNPAGNGWLSLSSFPYACLYPQFSSISLELMHDPCSCCFLFVL